MEIVQTLRLDAAFLVALTSVFPALTVLGTAVQAALFWLVIVYAMPSIGLGIFDMAEGLAALNLPARLLNIGAPI